MLMMMRMKTKKKFEPSFIPMFLFFSLLFCCWKIHFFRFFVLFIIIIKHGRLILSVFLVEIWTKRNKTKRIQLCVCVWNVSEFCSILFSFCFLFYSGLFIFINIETMNRMYFEQQWKKERILGTQMNDQMFIIGFFVSSHTHTYLQNPIMIIIRKIKQQKSCYIIIIIINNYYWLSWSICNYHHHHQLII